MLLLEAEEWAPAGKATGHVPWRQDLLGNICLFSDLSHHTQLHCFTGKGSEDSLDKWLWIISQGQLNFGLLMIESVEFYSF